MGYPNKMSLKKYVDKDNKFVELFDSNTGFYMRSGIIENGKDTGVDPFMRNYPGLIDVGVMGRCVHGSSGLCIKSGVECYQNGLNTRQPNMSLENFKKIVDECKGKTFQLALGGRGDVDQHENFKEIMSYCRDNDIVPNFTSSGLGFTDEIVDICKKYSGAIAISWYRQEHTIRAVNMLLESGVKTNIHYVLGNNSIDEAIDLLERDDFPKGINAVIFLTHKPVGLGSKENVLKQGDPRVTKFFSLVDNNQFHHKIGFDSCTVPGIINNTSNINPDSMDTCEGGRYSMYITSDMIGLPCSFDNQDLRWGVDLNTHTIQECWNSDLFEDFRNSFRTKCKGCEHHDMCKSGCPIRPEIVLCDSRYKDF